MQKGSRTNEGVKSAEYSSRYLLLIFATLILVVGLLICWTVMPDAFNNKHYPLVLFLASLPCIGIAGVWLAVKNAKLHTRFGKTKLRLDPEKPGIGGQLGARFTINPKQDGLNSHSQSKLLATVSCLKAGGSSNVNKNGGGATISMLWEHSVPVYLKQRADGLEASFVVDLPENGKPSNEADIIWQVEVSGKVEGLGELNRSWNVEVQDESSQQTSVEVPSNFSEKHEIAERKKAAQKSSEAIPLKVDNEQIEFSSQWLSRGAGITGVVIGAIFSAVGVFSFLDGWGAGIVFILVGVGLAVASIYAANNKVHIKVSKNDRKLYVYNELFGRSSLKHEKDITSAEQFSIVEMGSDGATKNHCGIYTVNFVSGAETIKLSTMIEGERAATALRNRIVSQLFPQDSQKLAA